MNIFKILSSNDGNIDEPNISSFLAYLLDDTEDHGLSSNLLKAFMESFVEKYPNAFEKLQFERPQNDNNKKIKNLDSINYSYTVQPEFRVDMISESKQKHRDIDIVIEVKNSDNQPVYVICIENKIRAQSIQKKQLQEELNGISSYYKNHEQKPEIYFCFLTPKSSRHAEEEFDVFCKDCPNTKAIHMLWSGEKSVLNKLSEIIKRESTSEIDPIPTDSLFMIKSFMAFINSDFRSRIEEKETARQRQDYGKPIVEYICDVLNENYKDDDSIKLCELRKKLENLVKEKSKKELVTMTRDCQTKKVIVNEPSRKSYHVTSRNAERYDLLYYSDPDKKTIVIKYRPKPGDNIKCYYSDIED